MFFCEKPGSGTVSGDNGRSEKKTLEYVTGYSLYAYEDEIRQGFISVQGGHRVGVTGKVVLDRAGSWE